MKATFNSTGDTERDKFLRMVHTDQGVGTNQCGTITPLSGATLETELGCHGSNWPGGPTGGNLGAWDVYIFIGLGGHSQNHGNNLSGIGAPPPHHAASYYVR